MKQAKPRKAVSKIRRYKGNVPLSSISLKKKSSSSKANCKKHVAVSSKNKSKKRSHTREKVEPIGPKPLSSSTICGATSRLSKSVMEKLRSSKSCKIVSEGGGDITIFQFSFGSKAYEIWKEHHLPGGKEPDVLDDSDPVYNIAPAFAGGAILPPMAAVWGINQAVTKALVTYAPLRKFDFARGALPVIPAGFVGYPPLGVKFHHSTIAAYKVLERIQTGTGLPDIMALPAGTNIVQLNIVYSNCALSILLVKS